MVVHTPELELIINKVVVYIFEICVLYLPTLAYQVQRHTGLAELTPVSAFPRKYGGAQLNHALRNAIGKSLRCSPAGTSK